MKLSFSLPVDGNEVGCRLLVFAAYLRYSSDLQDGTSLDDQLTRCREAAKRLGGYIPDDLVFIDEAISGQSMANRPGLQKLLRRAKEKPGPLFNGVISDDTSRVARNLEELIRIYKILRHRDIFLYFASSGLDSRMPGFDFGITLSGIVDEQFIPKLRTSIRRGMTGSIRRGYTPGGHHYGYHNIPEEDPNEKGLYGRPKVKGVRQVKNTDEESVIIRVFQMRADGYSHANIAKRLDAECIPLHKDGKKRSDQVWSASAIRGILRNETYRGRVVWGRTNSEKDPETGQVEVRLRPQSEWIVEQREDLRIVSEELWAAAHKHSERTREEGQQVRGGTERTQHSRGYIFSTLIECGVCGATYVIASGQHPFARYGCRRHRERRNAACSNVVTIAQPDLERQLLVRIVSVLQAPEFTEEMVREFRSQLFSAVAAQSTLAASAGNSDELQKELAVVEKEIDMLADGFAKSGSDIFIEKIKPLEVRRVEIRRMLSASKKPALARIDDASISTFLRQQFESLVDTLRGEPEHAKRQMAKLIEKKLVLTPETRNGERVLVVTGDLRLFADDDAMLGKSVERLAQHCIGLRLPLDGLLLRPYAMENSRLKKSSPGCVLSSEENPRGNQRVPDGEPVGEFPHAAEVAVPTRSALPDLSAVAESIPPSSPELFDSGLVQSELMLLTLGS